MSGQPVLTTSESQDYTLPAAKLLSQAFQRNPVIGYQLNHMTPEDRQAYFSRWFNSLMIAATLNKGFITEANNWQSCGVFITPGGDVGNPWTVYQAGIFSVLWNAGWKGLKKMLFEFSPIAKDVKHRALLDKNFIYCFFVGTLEEGRGKGLCSSIFREWQERAKKANVPIWLEATTEHSREIYRNLGFEVVESFVLGKGTADKDGRPEVGGEGVTLWGMVWWPNGRRE